VWVNTNLENINSFPSHQSSRTLLLVGLDQISKLCSTIFSQKILYTISIIIIIIIIIIIVIIVIVVVIAIFIIIIFSLKQNNAQP
jgi:hypothetical protein